MFQFGATGAVGVDAAQLVAPAPEPGLGAVLVDLQVVLDVRDSHSTQKHALTLLVLVRFPY